MEEQVLLTNDRIQIEISSVGAEPLEIWDKKENRNVLWNGNPKYWKRHSPILFPNVGKYYKNEFRYKGVTYSEGQHGFARDRVFECVSHTNVKSVHRLVSDDATREIYPFDFELTVTHTLVDNEIHIGWEVKNTGNGPMYFTIGGHPAFALLREAKDKSDYVVEIPGKDRLIYHLIDPETGNPHHDVMYQLKLKNHQIALSDKLFEKDALIFDNGQIEEAVLKTKEGKTLVTLKAKGFPNFGIWSVPGAPFVCLEPWIGRTDDTGFDGDISEKPGITCVQPGNVFNAGYIIAL